MRIETENGLKNALGYLENANPEEARGIIQKLFEYEFSCKELVFADDCCNFWIQRIRDISSMSNAFERGESLLKNWKEFRAFIANKKNVFAYIIDAVERGVFSYALENYEQLLNENDAIQKAEICCKAGLCCKKLGMFDYAKDYLVEANNLRPNVSQVLAELADCLALCGDDVKSKVVFKEAFFIEPDKIDISFFDSALIKSLIQITIDKGYTGDELLYWIPVYGVLSGVFNIKRELSYNEFVKLRHEIYSLETETKDPNSDCSILTPRLLNLYFWLVDYYKAKEEDSKKINDTLLKIRICDSTIFELYKKQF